MDSSASIRTSEHFSDTRSLECKRHKTLGFALVIIVSMGSLALMGVGLGGYLQAGALSHLGQINSTLMMVAGFDGVIIGLIITVIGSVKNCPKNIQQQNDTGIEHVLPHSGQPPGQPFGQAVDPSLSHDRQEPKAQQNRITQFFSYIDENGEGIPHVQRRFAELFTKNPSFTQQDLTLFIDALESGNRKTTKAFFLAISPQLAKQMFHYIVEDLNISEETCCYITLSHCRNIKNLCALDVLEKMEEAGITEEEFRYKFAMLALKHDASGFIKHLTEFEIEEPRHIRRLAEVSLYTSAHTFFSDFNEFNFDEDKVRDEFYLRGLMRSTEVVHDLLDDSDFFDTLQTLSEETLGFFYDTFNFCNITLRKACDSSQQALRNSQEATKELFVSIFKEHQRTTGLTLNYNFLHFAMDDRDKHAFLAMLFLVKSLENPDELLKQPELVDFLKELDSFPDPCATFATIAIVLNRIENGYSLTGQLNRLQSKNKGDYPKMGSVIHSACHHLLPSTSTTSTTDWVKTVWKHPNSRKHLICFVAELLLTDKLSYVGRGAILRQFIANKELHKPGVFAQTLIDFSVCLSRGLTKQLIREKSPTQILRENQLFFINQLGFPLGLSLSSDLFCKLKHTQEIAYYAQSLEKLSNLEEKEAMTRFFFKFLTSLANGTLAEERNTPELLKLFKTHKLDYELWTQETCSTVAQLVEIHHFSIPKQETLNIQAALQEAFRQGHLQASDYPLFCNYGFDKTLSAPPKLDRADFGKKSQNYEKLTEEDKKQVHTYLFCELFESTEKNKQIVKIRQLKKLFPTTSNFYVVDLLDWEKTLSQKKQSKDDPFEKNKDYKIIRSSDPYILFRVGSLGGGTCLRVTGDPGKTKSLLGFPCDGKNEVIYAQLGNKDPEACAILRFFYACQPTQDPTLVGKGGHEPLFPVLYLEPGSFH